MRGSGDSEAAENPGVLLLLIHSLQLGLGSEISGQPHGWHQDGDGGGGQEPISSCASLSVRRTLFPRTSRKTSPILLAGRALPA